MTRLILLGLTLILLAIPGLASATTLQDAITANATGKNVAVADKGSVGVAITIAGTATVTFQGSTNGGDTFDTISCIALGGTTTATTATATGQYTCTTAGLTHFQAPVSGCSGCTVTVKALGQQPSSGGSGGAESGLLTSILAVFTDTWDTVNHALKVTLATLISGEDQTNNLLMTSGGVVRITTLGSVTSATTSTPQIVPTGFKTFMGQITNATSETKAITATIYGNWTSSTTGGKALCTITLPSTATVTHLEDSCDWWAFNAPYSFYYFTTSVYTSASAAPFTIWPMY